MLNRKSHNFSYANANANSCIFTQHWLFLLEERNKRQKCEEMIRKAWKSLLIDVIDSLQSEDRQDDSERRRFCKIKAMKKPQKIFFFVNFKQFECNETFYYKSIFRKRFFAFHCFASDLRLRSQSNQSKESQLADKWSKKYCLMIEKFLLLVSEGLKDLHRVVCFCVGMMKNLFKMEMKIA